MKHMPHARLGTVAAATLLLAGQAWSATLYDPGLWVRCHRRKAG